MTPETALKKLLGNGYRARIDNGQVMIQCTKGIAAIRVKTDDPAVLEIVNSILPLAGAPKFAQQGEPGFTAIVRGKLKSQEIPLVNGTKVEVLANGEWIVVPLPNTESV